MNLVKYKMKKQKIHPILFLTALWFPASCNSNTTADQYLQDVYHRKDIVLTMVHHHPYMTVMMQEMMNNDSCKQMMRDDLMSTCKEDSNMCEMMMRKTIGNV